MNFCGTYFQNIYFYVTEIVLLTKEKDCVVGV